MMSRKPHITVVGSINTDMCVFVERLPGRGETVLGKRFVQAQGGKGANQAVGAARAGAEVTLIGAVGNDLFGRESIDALKHEDINTNHITVKEESSSGVALIFIDSTGENTIAVAPGANMALTPQDVQKAEKAISGADYLLLQLEAPVKTVIEAARIAADSGVPVLLNPAPAPSEALPAELLSNCNILTPNRTELNHMVKTADGIQSAASSLLSTGPATVIVTLGAEGVMLCEHDECRKIPAFTVEPVDTVGAGDSFCGALAVALAEARTVADAIEFALAAAAISVTRAGAQPSLPARPEIDSLLRQSSTARRVSP